MRLRVWMWKRFVNSKAFYLCCIDSLDPGLSCVCHLCLSFLFLRNVTLPSAGGKGSLRRTAADRSL